MLAFVVLGGGGDDDAAGVDSTKDSDPLNPNTGSSGAQSGDLRLLGGDPITMDPALAGDAGCATYIVEIFGGLVTLDRDLKVIARRRRELGGQPRRQDLHLLHAPQRPLPRRPPRDRRRLQVLDGARGAAEHTASTTAEAYLGDIVGAKDMIRGRAQSISGIKVVDTGTLRITIDDSKPYFLAKLTYPTAFVVDKNQVESNPRNWTRKPNGTGPYKLQEWRLNERIILQSNDRYHLGAPSVKRVLFNLAGGSSLTQYENDEIDVAGIGINDIERVRSPRDPLNKEYKTALNLSIGYIGFNTKKPPFDDAKVRQAFALAIDREQIAKVVFKDLAPVANSFLPEGTPGYDAVVEGPRPSTRHGRSSCCRNRSTRASCRRSP